MRGLWLGSSTASRVSPSIFMSFTNLPVSVVMVLTCEKELMQLGAAAVGVEIVGEEIVADRVEVPPELEAANLLVALAIVASEIDGKVIKIPRRGARYRKLSQS